MKPNQFQVVLVTAPDLKTARNLAQAALQEHLAACANLVPKIESHYWWKDQLQSTAEVMLFFKTTRPQLKALEACLLKIHPYETPEIIAWPIHHGNAHYLNWISQNVAGARPAA